MITQTTNTLLAESQLEAFLHSEGIPKRMSACLADLPNKIGKPVETILDCGGGNGMYLDMLLEIFSEAQGTLVDSAPFMLDQNVSHPRKRLLLQNLDDMDSIINTGQKFDLICFSDVLHHCIVPTYRGTRDLQTKILKNAAKLLAPGGLVLVSERIMDSCLMDEYSVRLTYALTRSRILAGITRWFGANTAGVGVCFASNNRFKKLCDDSGLALIEEINIDSTSNWSLKSQMSALIWFIALGARSLRHDLFLLTKSAD